MTKVYLKPVREILTTRYQLTSEEAAFELELAIEPDEQGISLLEEAVKTPSSSAQIASKIYLRRKVRLKRAEA